jgi:hypothetical protein
MIQNQFKDLIHQFWLEVGDLMQNCWNAFKITPFLNNFGILVENPKVHRAVRLIK